MSKPCGCRSPLGQTPEPARSWKRTLAGVGPGVLLLSLATFFRRG